mmetsp:Transcript_1012/g.2689  ORF Transcript_1012/g.2689 Transcript_1012/m.2689 type:complete len:399 (+) Transcript_1012:376-1572(+)
MDSGLRTGRGSRLGPAGSDEVGDVHRHLVDLRGVELLDVAQDADVLRLDEVDGDALAAEAAGAPDAVDVQLAIVGQVVANHKRHLLHVEAAAPYVRGNEHTAGARAELGHDLVALLLRHVTVHRRDGEVGLSHLLGEPVDLFLGVAEDDGLCDGERVVQVAQRVELPLFALDCHEKLLDALECELVALHQDAHRVRHEFGAHLENLSRHGRRDEHHLRRRRQVAVDVIDLLFEAAREHLVCLVDHQHLNATRAQRAPVDHVEDAARRAGHRMHASLEPAQVLSDGLAADARVALHGHEVAQGQHHLARLLGELARGREHEGLHVADRGVDGLQQPDTEDGGLARARLRLCDRVAPPHDGDQRALLDGGRTLEAIGVNPPQQVLTQAHRVEGADHHEVL